MFVAYVDSSGSSTIGRDGDLFILTGAVVAGDQVRGISQAVTDLKRGLIRGYDPHGWELHGQDIWRTPKNFESLGISMNFALKSMIFSRTADLVAGSDMTIISIVVRKDKITDTKSPVLEYAWKLLLERIEMLLEKEKDSAIIVTDNSTHMWETRISRTVKNMIMHGTSMKMSHIIPTVPFARSDLEELIQIADMASYIVRRHQIGDKKFGKWFDAIRKKMYVRNGSVEGAGFKIHP